MTAVIPEVVQRELVASIPHALRAAQLILGDHDDAEEAVSEALEAALLAAAAGSLPLTPRPWLVKVARNKAVDQIRRRERERKHLCAYVAQAAAVQAPEQERVDDASEADWLRRKARGLPPATRAVLATIQQTDTLREAADNLAMSKRAAEGHLQRARKRLLAAWSATLGIIAGLGVRLRRGLGSGTPSTALVSAALLTPFLVIGTGPGGHGGGSSGPIPHVDDRFVTSTAAPLGTPLAVRAARQSLRVHPTPAAAFGSTAVDVTTPVSHPRVYTTSRPGSDNFVRGTIECLQQFEIEPGDHIGC